MALAVASAASLLVVVAATPAATATAAGGPLAPLAADTGLAFSGSGFLGIFFVGVLQAFQDLGLVDQSTRVAGTSGGSLVSGVNCLGLGRADALAVATGINDECRGQWSCAGQLDKAVRASMRNAVTIAMVADGRPKAAPQSERDAFVVGRCAGRARFTVSVVDGSGQQRPGAALKAARPWFVSDFRNEEDFVSAGAASSYIPIFSGGGGEAGAAAAPRPAPRGGVGAKKGGGGPLPATWHTLFRGQSAVDGGFSAALPPCVPGVGACVTVEATTKQPGAPGMPGMGPPTGPPLPPADISPGKFSPLPGGLTRKQWQQHALIAPRDGLAKDMERHGYEQAVLWACAAHADLMGPVGKCARAAAGAGGASSPPRRAVAVPMMRG